MPEPTLDHSTGWWSIRVKMWDGSRKKFMLAKHPGWSKGKKLPKKPPPDIELLARKYQDMGLSIRHGVDVTPARPKDLKAFLSEYMSHYEAAHKENSLRILKQAVAHFTAWCESKGIRTVEAVSFSACEDYMRARKKSGAARGTVGLEKGCLSPVWTRAIRSRVMADNPWSHVQVPGKPDTKEPPYWTAEELDKLIGAARGRVRDIILVAANTGGRISSVVGLEWRDAAFDEGLVYLNSKTGRYSVPMSGVARDVLERLSLTTKSRSKFVFPVKNALGHVTRGAAYTAIRRAARDAGIPEKGHYAHILRHTFASHAVMRGVPLVTVSKWLGHTSIHMTMRYAHLSPSESKRMMEGFSLGTDSLQQSGTGATTPPPAGQTGTSAPPLSPDADSPTPPSSPSEEASTS